MTFNRFSLIKIQILKYIRSQIGFLELAHNIYKIRRNYRPNGLHDNAKKLLDVCYRGVNLSVKPHQEVHKQIFYGYFEKHVVDVLETIIRPGDICLDVGANIGFYACKLSQLVGDKGHVFAFEPVEYNAKLLRLNALKNGARNVTLCNHALGSKEEQLEMNIYPEDDFLIGHNSFVENETIQANKNHTKTMIDVLPIDDVLTKQEIKRVDFVKIDIEGFEHQFFSGATRLLNEFKPVFIFEHSPQRLIDLNIDEADFKSFFKDYDIYQMHLGGLEPYHFDGDATAPDLLAIPKGREWGGNS